MTTWPILFIVTFLPIVGALIVYALIFTVSKPK